MSVSMLPQAQDVAVLLFLLPEEPEKLRVVQDKFLCNREFWSVWLSNLRPWTEPLGISRTETPDGKAALALLLKNSPIDTLFYEVGHAMAEELECPAYTFLYTSLDADMREELMAAPKPW